MKEKLRALFADVLEVESSMIPDNLAYSGIPEWDSVAHMAIIAEIEDVFDIMIDTDDVIGMSSFAIACDTVLRLQEE
jgi:acyl carrier protein